MINQIIFILFSILITCLWVLGIYVMLKDGMILFFVSRWDRSFFDVLKKPTRTKYILYYILKPVYKCPPCMNSLHGLFIVWFLSYILKVDFSIFNWIIISVCSVPIVYSLMPKFE